MTTIKPYQINLFLCLALIGIGLVSFEASNRDKHTLIVPLMGILLSLFHRPLKNNESKATKWAFYSTIAIFIIMLIPFKNTLESQHIGGLWRVSLILVACLIAIILYLNHFKKSTNQF